MIPGDLTLPDHADALRDAFALLRAAHAGDEAGTEVVAANLAEPRVTAMILAEMLAANMRASGGRIESLAEWQKRVGLLWR